MQFNFIAKYYTFISRAVFGKLLERAKVSLFNQIADYDRVLIIGGGTGVSLETLLKKKPNLTIDFVEPSSEMVKRAKSRTGVGKVNFYCQPIEEFEGTTYDVIITEFFLDLFTDVEIENHISSIKVKLSTNGIWVDTDFRYSKKLYTRALIKLMYLFFRIVSNVKVWNLIETKKIAQSQGFLLKKESRFKSGLITSRLFIR